MGREPVPYERLFVARTAGAIARLAILARDAGAGGLVCSALEVQAARRLFAAGTLVVPGIRSRGTRVDNDDPVATVDAIAEELLQAEQTDPGVRQ